MMQFNIKFLTRHRKARIAPDPAFPKGRDIGMSAVRRFAEEARSEGLVRRVAARAGLRGVLSVE